MLLRYSWQNQSKKLSFHHLRVDGTQYTLRGQGELTYAHTQRISNGIRQGGSYAKRRNFGNGFSTKEIRGRACLYKICLHFGHIACIKETVFTEVGSERRAFVVIK